ncbi:UNVERIFIED_ORG: hypothetical protein ABIC62_001906 [Burkholderia sp. 1595]|uniref:CR-type domain-containing protein n=1 Tax=Paraburkholderia terricola TaxID=169427 RepID=A0ABU1LP49_9BURK|nr:hypothetical protein [Paraburkholderia terricola]MDR6408516.1 hypothetical protein [Paraburkholderia terricola]
MSELKERAGIAMNVRVQLADVAPDRQVTLGALAMVDELGNMLWHMKYGQDLRRRALHRASLLLASRIAEGSRYRRGKSAGAKFRDAKVRDGKFRDPKRDGEVTPDGPSLIVRFAERAIVEWIADQCSACGGRGMRGGGGRIVRRVDCRSCRPVRDAVDARLRFSRWPISDREPCPTCYGKGFYEERPFAEVPHLCTHCNGSGKEPVNAAKRAQALGVPLDQYHRRWAARFEWLGAVLTQIDSITEAQFRRGLRGA